MANASVKEIKQAIQGEKLLMPKISLSYYITKEHYYLSCDVYASALLFDFPELVQKVAVATTPDGNCLFNAASIALCGNKSLATCLRLLCSIAMITHEEIY